MSTINEKDWEDLETEVRERRVGSCPRCERILVRLAAAETALVCVMEGSGGDAYGLYAVWRAIRDEQEKDDG